MAKRIPWLDNIKGICILFVLFAHCCIYFGYDGPANNSLLTGSYSPFYVSAFFFASGYMYLNKLVQSTKNDIGTLVKNILFRIMIPTVIFSLLVCVPKMIFHHEIPTVSSFLLDTIGGCSYWFTPAIAVSQLLLIVIVVIGGIKNEWTICLISLILAATGEILAGIQNNPFPWYYKSGMLATAFLATGFLYRKYEGKLDGRWKLAGFMVAYIAFLIYFWPQGVVHCSIISVNYNLMGIIATVLGIMVITGISKLIQENKVLAFVGKNSLTYYLLSGLIPATCSTLAQKMTTEKNILIVLFIYLTALFLSTIAVIIINKYFYKLLDLRKKKEA